MRSELGALPKTSPILEDLQSLPMARIADEREILHFIVVRKLSGVEIGLVDAHLLAAVVLTPGVSPLDARQKVTRGGRTYGNLCQDIAKASTGLHACQERGCVAGYVLRGACPFTRREKRTTSPGRRDHERSGRRGSRNAGREDAARQNRRQRSRASISRTSGSPISVACGGRRRSTIARRGRSARSGR